MSEKRVVVLVRMYAGWAMYEDDLLKFHQRDGRDWPAGALKALGFHVRVLHATDQQFWGGQDYSPHPSLTEMKRRWDLYKSQERLRRMEQLRDALLRMEREEVAPEPYEEL